MTPIFGGFRTVATAREFLKFLAKGHRMATNWLCVVLQPNGLFVRAKQRS
jgi:hypothetical protein